MTSENRNSYNVTVSDICILKYFSSMKLACTVQLKKALDNNFSICIKTTFLKQLVIIEITFLVALPVPSKIVLNN